MGGHAGLWLAKAGANLGGPVLTLLLLLLMLRGVFVLLDAELGRFFYTDLNAPADAGWVADDAGAAAVASGSRMMQPAGVALHPFIMFSAYRMDESTLYVLGLAARLVRDYARPIFYCQWHPDDPAAAQQQQQQQQWGAPEAAVRARVFEGSTDWGHMPYTETILECRFPRPVGADARGGALRLVIQADAEAGVTATQRLPGRQVTVATLEALREPAGLNLTAAPKHNRRFKYAFCSAPISGAVRAEALRPWFVYHLHLFQAAAGDAHFFLYNVGGLDARARAVLAPLQDAGLVTVWDVLQQPLFPAWWTSQILFMDDCVHRHRHSADWVIFHDFDEYLYVAPPLTLPQLLATHADAPVLTWGSWEIDIESCVPESLMPAAERRQWPFHRMRWRLPRPECRDDLQPDPYMCTGSLARRKYALNPRKEISVVVHYTLGHAYTQARHLHAAVARIEHYRSIFSVDRVPCSHSRAPGARVADEVPRHSWSVLEMDCAVCQLVPEAMAYVDAMFNSTRQGRAFVRDLLAKSSTLHDPDL